MSSPRRNLLVGLAATATGCALRPAHGPSKPPAPVRLKGLSLASIAGRRGSVSNATYALPLDIEVAVNTNREVQGPDHLVVALLRNGEVINEVGGVALRDAASHSLHTSTVTMRIDKPGDYEVVASDVRGRPLRQPISVRRSPALWERSHVLVANGGSYLGGRNGHVTAALSLWLPCDEVRAYSTAWHRDGQRVHETWDTTPKTNHSRFTKPRDHAERMHGAADLEGKSIETVLWRHFMLTAHLPEDAVVPGPWEVHVDIAGFGRWRVGVDIGEDRLPEGVEKHGRGHVGRAEFERAETPSEIADELATKTAAARPKPVGYWAGVRVTAAELRGLTRSLALNKQRAAHNVDMGKTDEEVRGLARRFDQRVFDPATGGTKIVQVHQGASKSQRDALYQRTLGRHRAPLRQLIETHGGPWSDEELIF